MRCFPGARQLVYDRRQSLPIGFAPAERGSPIFSLVLYPRWVRFFFLEGVAIDDPEGRLEGAGSQFRSIRLDDRAAILDDPVHLRAHRAGVDGGRREPEGRPPPDRAENRHDCTMAAIIEDQRVGVHAQYLPGANEWSRCRASRPTDPDEA